MSVAEGQIRAFVDRILRLKEEVKAIQGDIREVYAEAKGNGFDKTALGKLVNYVQKRTSDAGELAEQDALFDLYLEAYDSASHPRAYARDHQLDHDPVTGEVNEPDAALRPQTEAVVGSVSSNAGAGAVASPATNSLSSAALPRKTEDRSVVAALHSSAPVTHSNPVTAPAPQVTVDAGRESASDPSALPVVRHDHSKPHPDCQDPEDCGLASWTHMCGGCLRARAAKQASVALQ